MSFKKIEEVTDEFWENEINEVNRELIEDFLSQRHLSPQTLKQYESALKIFAKWVYDNTYSKKQKTEKIIPELKPRDALKYQNYLIGMGLSPNAVKFKRSAVSSLCGFIELYYSDEYKDFRNIYTKNVPSVHKSNVKEKVPLTMKEIEKISRILTKNEEWQKLAYLWFTYSTGCRRAEARQLLKEVTTYKIAKDKQGNNKKYYLTHTIRAKGGGIEGKPRKFKFDQRAMDAIQKWIEFRSSLVDSDDCEYVFVSKRNGVFQQLSANTFNLWCKEFSEMIGGKPVHPHLFRSSRATIAVVEEGHDIKAVQKMLGHNSSTTTEIYIVRDDEDDEDDLY